LTGIPQWFGWPELDERVRALIEEAWRRARRRRWLYGAIASSLAVIWTIVFATLQGPADSPEGSPPVLEDASAQASPASVIASRPVAPAHSVHGLFDLDGEHGNIKVAVRLSGQGREWDVVHGSLRPRRPGEIGGRNTGQYALLVGGGGHVEAGGHAGSWYARLAGYVENGGPRQHVVIMLKGRPSGTFVITPTEPGPLERDSGTQRSGWLG